MDKYRENVKLVQKALNQECAFMQPDPYLAQRVLNEAQKEGGAVVMKKRTVGFVLAIVLMLLSVTAFAAIGLSALYEHVIEQEGKSGNIEDWSAAEKVALVDLMVEAGIDLEQDQVESLFDEQLSEAERDELAWQIITSYYPARDNVLTSVDIMAKEKGPIENWELEDRAWLSEMLAQYQPDEVKYGMNLIPSQADITQSEALEVFYQYYEKKYGIDRSMFKKETATCFFGESAFDDGTGMLMLRRWVINMQLSSGEEMGAYIRADGEVISATAPNNMEAAWRNELSEDMLSDDFLTVEGMYRFEVKWRPRMIDLMAVGEDVTETNLYDLLNGKSYGLPLPNEISRDEAYAIACNALIGQENWGEDSLQYYDDTAEAYRTEDPDGSVYWFTFMRVWRDLPLSEQARALGYPVSVTVKVDPVTGEVKEIVQAGMYFTAPADRFGM